MEPGTGDLNGKLSLSRQRAGESAGDAHTAFGFGSDFESSPNEVGAIVHDLKPDALTRCSSHSNAVIFNFEYAFATTEAAKRDADFTGLAMADGVVTGFLGDSVDLGFYLKIGYLNIWIDMQLTNGAMIESDRIGQQLKGACKSPVLHGGGGHAMRDTSDFLDGYVDELPNTGCILALSPT